MRLSEIVRGLPGSTMLMILVLSSSILGQGSSSKVLGPPDLEKLFPATVYYLGQTAPAQLRNSGGVKFADGHYVLASLVDNSGYSTAVAGKYQGYLIIEVPIRIEGQRLAAGAYGIGFLDGGKFLVTDLGGGDVLALHSSSDQTMTRPRPLQVTADSAGGFRLYAGRSYVRFNR